MTDPTTFAKFREAYIKELVALYAANPALARKHTPEKKADSMIAEITKSGNCDWLAYNPALKRAAATVGLKTSPKLREFIKGNQP